MKVRIFHVHSNRKKIREVTWETYRNMDNRGVNYLFVRVTPTAIMFHMGNYFIYMTRSQLEAILKECANDS